MDIEAVLHGITRVSTVKLLIIFNLLGCEHVLVVPGREVFFIITNRLRHRVVLERLFVEVLIRAVIDLNLVLHVVIFTLELLLL